MFCKYCGTKLIDNAIFCHECGKATCEQPVSPPPVQLVFQQPAQPVQQQPVFQQPVMPPVQYTYTVPAQPAPRPVVDPVQLEKLRKQTLTLGILGLCLSMFGVPGIILSGIAAKKAGAYKKLTGKVDGRVLTGYRLAKAGRIVSIIMTVLLTFLLPALLEGDVTYDYDYSHPFEYYDF